MNRNLPVWLPTRTGADRAGSGYGRWRPVSHPYAEVDRWWVLAHVSDLHLDGGPRAAARAQRVLSFLDGLRRRADAVLQQQRGRGVPGIVQPGVAHESPL